MLFDISNGSPGLSLDFNFDEIVDQFYDLTIHITKHDSISSSQNKIIKMFSDFENEKFKIYLSLIKFILTVLKKVLIGIDIQESYLSKNVLKIKNLSNTITLDVIDKKFDYLINNENDLFTLNLDKNFFMINFFAIK